MGLPEISLTALKQASSCGPHDQQCRSLLWTHDDQETLSAWPALCVGNPRSSVDPLTAVSNNLWNFNISSVISLYKLLNSFRWVVTSWPPMWCHCNALQWRHNWHDSVPNHQPYDCLLNRLFRRRSKKTSKLRVTGLCAGNSPGTGEFPAQMASYAENVSIWWRHHG